MKVEEKFFTFFLLTAVLFMIVLGFNMRAGSRTVPIALGLCTLVLMLILSLMAVSPTFDSWYHKLEARVSPASFGELSDREKDSQEITEKPQFRKKEISIVGWLLFVTAATYILGFMVGGPIFLFLFLKLWAKEGWLLSLNITAAVFGVVYLIFVYMLQIPLHEGILVV